MEVTKIDNFTVRVFSEIPMGRKLNNALKGHKKRSPVILKAFTELPPRAQERYLEWNVSTEIRLLSRLKAALFFDSTWDHDLLWALFSHLLKKRKRTVELLHISKLHGNLRLK